jgi:hypothetical protein
MSVRSAVALQQGPYEHLVEQIDEPGATDLSEAQRLAVRLADAYFHDPGGMTDDLREHLLARFTPAEILEIVMRVAVNSVNKVRVSLGIDRDEIEYHVYTPGGAH